MPIPSNFNPTEATEAAVMLARAGNTSGDHQVLSQKAGDELLKMAGVVKTDPADPNAEVQSPTPEAPVQ